MEESGTPGQTMVDAIYEKYDDADTLIHIHIAASAPGKKDSGHIQVPPILALHDSNITSPGDTDKLSSICKQVQELDLTKNSINDWEQVVEIIERIPRLRFLNLTCNPIDNRSSWQCEKQFQNVNNLVLNNTGVSWDCLVKLLHVFPRVTELHLSINGYTSVDLPADFQYPILTKLHLNGNKIKDLMALCQIGLCFPNLENLVAMECEIDTLLTENDLKETFPCLKSLNLSKTNLSSWEDIDVFRQFPVLTDVRVKDIPFLQTLPEKERRQMIVARLPNITKLNGSPVYDQEREDAERAFLRKFMDQEEKPKRYYDLEQIYGRLECLADVDLAPEDLYYHMKVKYENREEIMDLLKTQTVKELKKLLQNFCGIPIQRIQLYEYKPDYDNYNNTYRICSETRYYELEQIYGRLECLADVDLAPEDLYYHMKVKYENREEIMDLLKTQTVKELKKLLQNFCGIPIERIQIYEYKPDYNDIYRIWSETRSLHSFRWTNMDEIHVYDKAEKVKIDTKNRTY